MNELDNSDLRKLANVSAVPPLVSIYIPTERAGREVRQNQIRWKNALKDAMAQLGDCQLDSSEIRQVIKPAESLVENSEFWQHQKDGLAFFVFDHQTETVQLDYPVEQRVVIGKTLHIRPLLDSANREHRCHILAASPKRVRLLRVTNENVEDLQPTDLPGNLRDALNIDEYVSSLQFHLTSQPVGRSRAEVAHHGHGGSDPDVKKRDEILQYFRRVDDALDEFLADKSMPLIFVGVDYLFPIFKKAYRYDNLCDKPISGNPDELSPREIADQVRPLLDSAIEKENAERIAEYQKKAASDWASCDVQTIFKSASLGQVEYLLLSTDFQCFGNVKTGGELMSFTKQKSPEANIDIANSIVVQTLKHGGTAFSIDSGQMPDGIEIASVFRSPVGQFVQ